MKERAELDVIGDLADHGIERGTSESRSCHHIYTYTLRTGTQSIKRSKRKITIPSQHAPDIPNCFLNHPSTLQTLQNLQEPKITLTGFDPVTSRCQLMSLAQFLFATAFVAPLGGGTADITALLVCHRCALVRSKCMAFFICQGISARADGGQGHSGFPPLTP